MNDYGRRDRIAKASLSKHAARMAELEASGMPRLEASKLAYQEMTQKQREQTLQRYGQNE